jgi:hypothetical protein
MLWSYAKLPVAPPAVVMALVSKITDQLVQHSQRPDGSPTFDAQVCCGTALLHPRLMPYSVERQPDSSCFCLLLAYTALGVGNCLFAFG